MQAGALPVVRRAARHRGNARPIEGGEEQRRARRSVAPAVRVGVETLLARDPALEPQPAVAGVSEREEVFGSAHGPRHQIGPLEGHARRRERAGDARLAVRPVRHLHVLRQQETQRDEGPVDTDVAVLAFGQEQVGGLAGQGGRARHVVPDGPERTEQHTRGAQGRVVAAPLGHGPRALQPRRLPAVGGRQLAQPGNGEVGSRRVQGDEGPDRADQPVEVVVLGGIRDPAYQRRGDLVAQGELAGRQVTGASDLRQHVRQPGEAGVQAVGVLTGLVLARVLR